MYKQLFKIYISQVKTDVSSIYENLPLVETQHPLDFSKLHERLSHVKALKLHFFITRMEQLSKTDANEQAAHRSIEMQDDKNVTIVYFHQQWA